MRKANDLPSVQVSARSMSDLELLGSGAFWHLDRFMRKADNARVLEEMRLADGRLFPIPINLPLTEKEAVHIGREIALRSPKNELIASMLIEEVFQWDPRIEAREVCGTTDSRHPLVAEMASWGSFYISGPLKVLNLPKHCDFPELRRTPAEVRTLLERLGYPNVVAFQTRNPMHRAHEELTKRGCR